MLTEFDFHVTQLRYIKAAVNDIPTYKPDGKNVADLDTVLTNALAVRQAGAILSAKAPKAKWPPSR